MNRKIVFRRVLPILICVLTLLIGGAVFAQEGGFSESFDDPSLPGWERSANVEVVGGVLQIAGDGYALHDGAWADVTLQVKANLDGAGSLKISYSRSDTAEYALQISSEEIVLLKAGEQLAGDAIEFIPSGEWFQVEINLHDNAHEIRLNGQAVLQTDDPDRLPPGGIALAVEGGATGQFDDVFVDSSQEGGLPETPEEEPQEPAPTAETQPTQESNGEASSSDLTWIRTGGPPGGLGYDIRYNFDQPTTWYVTDVFAGVHISTDDGLTWQPSNSGIPAQLGPTSDWFPIFCLTVDPHNPQIVWTGTDKTGRIYKSTDGGSTWTEKDQGVVRQTSEYEELSFRGFTVDPNSSEIVYAMGEIGDPAKGGPVAWSAGNGGVVYKTTDGGENWELIWDGGIPSSLARYMWIDPDDTNILYVSTGIWDRSAANEGDPETDTDPYGGLGVLKSTDGGKTWRFLDKDNGLDFLYINSLFMHPDDPDTLLAAPSFDETELFAQYLTENNLDTPMGVYRTTDGGENWTQVLSERPGVTAVEICPSDHNIAYAVGSHAVYRSSDAGQTWNRVTEGDNGWGPPGVLAGNPIDLQCDPNDPDRIFSNNYLGGNFLSEDGGKTWSNASDGYTGAQVVSVAVDPNDPAQVYVAGRTGIWGSSDGGSSWHGLRYPESGAVIWGGEFGGIVIDPSDSNHLLVSEETIWETDNGGAEWKIRTTPAFALAGSIVFAPSDPNVVYTGRAQANCLINIEAVCSEGNGVYVSQDGGTTWQYANDANMENKALIDLAVDPNDPQHVYAATQDGLYITTDGGANWNLVGSLPAGARVDSITIHPEDAKTLLAGVENYGLYSSTNDGDTWTQIAAGLQPNILIRDVLYDPTDSQTVYLSDLMSGIYRSLDGGQTWTQISDGLIVRSTTRMGISSDGQHLYTATNGDGVYRLDLNGQPPVAQASAPDVEETTEVEPAATPTQESPADEPAVETPAENPAPQSGIIIGAAVLLILCAAIVIVMRRRK